MIAQLIKISNNFLFPQNLFGEVVENDGDDEVAAKIDLSVLKSLIGSYATEAESSTTEALSSTTEAFISKTEEFVSTSEAFISDSSTAAPTSTTDESSPELSPATTRDLIEVLKVLEQPEELTTLAQELTTLPSLVNEPAEPVLTRLPAAVVVSPLEEVYTAEAPSTLSTTQEQPTQAPSTIATPAENIAFPTEFEKLLTTLREFVARADSLRPTEAPKTSPAPQLEQQIEFVNYTVSAALDDETKTISKRSVPDADLIPRFFKQHYASSKDNGCVFNSSFYKLGEAIKTDNECLKCICEYAPIGHCMLKEKCNF